MYVYPYMCINNNGYDISRIFVSTVDMAIEQEAWLTSWLVSPLGWFRPEGREHCYWGFFFFRPPPPPTGDSKRQPAPYCGGGHQPTTTWFKPSALAHATLHYKGGVDILCQILRSIRLQTNQINIYKRPRSEVIGDFVHLEKSIS